MSKNQPTALVTGASRGIGLAASLRLLECGHRVAMVDREPIDTVSEALAPHRDAIHTYALDVTDQKALCNMREDLNKRWGPLRVLINNAGISFKQPGGRASSLVNTTDEEWESVVAVNLTAVMRLCRLFIPDMQMAGVGRIVNIASLAGRTRSRVAGPAYVATKTGVIGLTRAIAGEFGRVGITANCVAPGRIITAMSGPADTDVNQAYLAQIPSARLGTVDDVAAAIAYLASDDASFVNGAVVDVNGGAHMA